jgi:hypothetical protein
LNRSGWAELAIDPFKIPKVLSTFCLAYVLVNTRLSLPRCTAHQVESKSVKIRLNSTPLLISVFVVFLTPVANNIDADVIAQWHFDETGGGTAFDSVGSVNGTLAGDAAFAAGGISGNAVSMTRAGGGLVNMGDNFGFTSGDFSIVSWVKLAAGDTTTDYFIAGKHRSTQVAGYFLGVNTSSTYGGTNKSYFYDSNPSGPTAPVSTTTINDGGWHQVVGVYHAGGLSEIYVDGGGVEDSKTAATIGGISQSFLIGGISNSGGTPVGFLNGMVDEVQLYDSALSSNEVQFLFENPALTAVPEPSSFAIACLGLTGIVLRRNRPVATK